MTAASLSGLWSALAEVGVSGAVDIAVMSVLLYLALSWLRGIRRVLQGALVLVAAYVAARLFHLDLSATALEVTFVVVVIAAIVTFRDEVRQAIERIAVFYRFRAPQASAELTLGHSLFQLAAEHVGALVVIEGRDRVEDLIHGGTALDGLPSDALIHSLFDPSSPGHDGAALFRGGRVVRFGCHLPLSTNFAELASRGTRHAAALGLAERCDGLAIVVSEERGVVSVGQTGKLTEISSAEELDALVAGYAARSVDAPRARGTKPRRVRTAAGAVAIAALLWTVLIYGTQPSQRTFQIAVGHADLPTSLRVASVSPQMVKVTLTGARREFFFVDDKSLRVSVPLSAAHEGRLTFNLSATDVSVPASLGVKSIAPSQIVVLVGKR